MGHTTSQVPGVQRYLDTGDASMKSVKVPLYMQASGVPETGFQTRLPVPDAHWGRALGVGEVRTTNAPGVSIRPTEYTGLGDWYREKIARPLGIEAVPAQARQWNVFGPQTGVNTTLGAPKLELLSQAIWERAARLGMDPRVLRDQVLTGANHAAWIAGLPVGAGIMGGLADQSGYPSGYY
jgi:hypothetical protein